ncbi:hypothetical protein ACQPZQ_20360 [Pseudonocardia sp. CA-142604]|uniref:hypothetical protein n=1 Tax=Pseudonocardia sp. CA-142604 TaxID=3240024 RepID=UPI003D8A6FA6
MTLAEPASADVRPTGDLVAEISPPRGGPSDPDREGRRTAGEPGTLVAARRHAAVANEKEQQMGSATIRACGAAVALGGVIWGTAGLIAPTTDGVVRPVEVWASGAFLLGVIALVSVVRATRATGDGRWAGGLLAAELVMLALAALSTVITPTSPDYELAGALLVLDTAWPLSMLGLVAIAGAVVARRRWPARTRWLMLATSLWLPVGFVAPDAVTSVYLIVVPLLLGAAIIGEVAPRHGRTPGSGHDEQHRAEGSRGSGLEKPLL